VKVCNKCNQQLPLASFSRDASKRDGRQSWCKECQAAYGRCHYLNHIERYRTLQFDDEPEPEHCEDTMCHLQGGPK